MLAAHSGELQRTAVGDGNEVVQDGSLVELMARLKEEGKSLSLRDILTIFLQVLCPLLVRFHGVKTWAVRNPPRKQAS